MRILDMGYTWIATPAARGLVAFVPALRSAYDSGALRCAEWLTRCADRYRTTRCDLVFLLRSRYSNRPLTSTTVRSQWPLTLPVGVPEEPVA
jgi:hypothetical protein